MKIIKDERLILQGLKNIRIAFIFQTFGILAIIIYDAIIEGPSHALANPLWMLFMFTIVILGWMNLKISIDLDDSFNHHKKRWPYYGVTAFIALIGIIFGLFAKFGPDQSSNFESLVVGLVVFICFMIPYSVVYFIRKKRDSEE